MKANKYFSKYPECYLELPELDDEGKPIEGKFKRVEGYYLGTVREVASKESFITSVDLGLVRAGDGLLKVPLGAIHFRD